MRNHQLPVCLPSRRNHRTTVFCRQRHRLFAQDVIPCFHGLYHTLLVQHGRQCDIHDFKPSGLQHFVEIVVNPNRLRKWRIICNIRDIARHFCRKLRQVRVADCNDFRTSRPAPRAIMGASHETITDNSHPFHFPGLSLSFR